LRLSPTLSVEPQAGEEYVAGVTSGHQEAIGRRTTWLIQCNRTELPVWDTVWSTGDREIVLARPDYIPHLPTALVNLMGRRRATIELRQDRRWLMTIRLVLPDATGWPRFKKCSKAELYDACGSGLLDRLGEVGLVALGPKQEILGATGRNRDELCAITDDTVSPATIATYVVTRVVPTLSLVGYA
jgi:hypothetical protein